MTATQQQVVKVGCANKQLEEQLATNYVHDQHSVKGLGIKRVT